MITPLPRNPRIALTLLGRRGGIGSLEQVDGELRIVTFRCREQRLPREAVFPQQIEAAPRIANAMMKLEHGSTDPVEQFGVVLDKEQLRAFDVALEQVDRVRKTLDAIEVDKF